jgi:ABC-type Fe3+-hydroxamate transport system substrate-binding protein
MTTQLIDAYGNHHPRIEPNQPTRIVCLVPSITELLFDLGIAHYLVGRTGFCIHPKATRDVPKIGGTKDINFEKIKRLAPTHLIVNIDENEKPSVEKLAEFIPHIIVTHPITPRDNLSLFQLLGAIFNVDSAASNLCEKFENAYQQLTSKQHPHNNIKKVLYCIWKDPWMSVSKDTYIAQMLALKNWQHVKISSRDRYPTFEWTETLLDNIDAVLLSTEPYSFTQDHADQLAKEIKKPVFLVDGEMFSWYGSRSILGLEYLKNLNLT